MPRLLHRALKARNFLAPAGRPGREKRGKPYRAAAGILRSAKRGGPEQMHFFTVLH